MSTTPHDAAWRGGCMGVATGPEAEASLRLPSGLAPLWLCCAGLRADREARPRMDEEEADFLLKALSSSATVGLPALGRASRRRCEDDKGGEPVWSPLLHRGCDCDCSPAVLTWRDRSAAAMLSSQMRTRRGEEGLLDVVAAGWVSLEGEGGASKG